MTSASRIFDRELYLARSVRASGPAVDLLDQRIAEELIERLSVINRRFESVLLIAPRVDGFAPALLRLGNLAARTMRPPETDDLALPQAHYDSVISLLDLHCVNDVPGYLAQVTQSLKPDGLALFAFFAGDTLRELRQSWLAAEAEIMGGASPRVAPMIDLRETGGLLQRAGLALPVADIDRVTLRYDNAFALMREVKALGYANAQTDRAKTLTSRRLLLRSADIYQRDHADENSRVSATIEVAWAMAWKPHPSQQQPLKPGSAKARLADALGARDDQIGTI